MNYITTRDKIYDKESSKYLIILFFNFLIDQSLNCMFSTTKYVVPNITCVGNNLISMCERKKTQL